MLSSARLRWIRNSGLFAGLVCALTGCSAILGLRDIDEGPALDADSGPGRTEAGPPSSSDALVEVLADEGSDSLVDAGTDGEAGFCGAYPNALFCDDFEDATYSSKWRPIIQSGVVKVVRPGAGGAKGNLVSNFDPIPSSGKAALAFDNLPAGKRSLRFSLYVPFDSYPTTGMPIAALVDNATGDGVRVEMRTEGASLKLGVRDTRDGGSPAPLPDIAYNKWYCIEVEVDGAGSIAAWLDKNPKSTGTATTATANGIATAEIGMTWTFGGNAGSVTLHYDDVVIATGAVGCP